MPPGGAERSSQTGFDRATTLPSALRIWVRTKLALLVSIVCVTAPLAKPAAPWWPITRRLGNTSACPAYSTSPWITCSVPFAGRSVAYTVSLREVTEETLTDPVGADPSISRSMLPRYPDRDAAQARPLPIAVSRSGIAVLLAQTDVYQLLLRPYLFWPQWSSLE